MATPGKPTSAEGEYTSVEAGGVNFHVRYAVYAFGKPVERPVPPPRFIRIASGAGGSLRAEFSLVNEG